MARRLERPNAHGGTTDHSEEISALQEQADRAFFLGERLCFRLAAELLLAHDETGISLDDWPTARQFVESRLEKPILPNLI